jgi:hypothetical protein
LKYRDSLLLSGAEHDRLLQGAIDAAEHLLILGEMDAALVTPSMLTKTTTLMGRKMGAYAKYMLANKYRHMSKGKATGWAEIQN